MTRKKDNVEYVINTIKRFLGLGLFAVMVYLHVFVKEISVWIFAVPFTILGVQPTTIISLIDAIRGKTP